MAIPLQLLLAVLCSSVRCILGSPVTKINANSNITRTNKRKMIIHTFGLSNMPPVFHNGTITVLYISDEYANTYNIL